MQFKSSLLLLAVTLTVLTALPTREKRQWIPPSTLMAEQQARSNLAFSQYLSNQAVDNSNYLRMQAEARQRQDLMNSQMLSNQAIMNSQMAIGRAQLGAAAPFMWG